MSLGPSPESGKPAAAAIRRLCESIRGLVPLARSLAAPDPSRSAWNDELFVKLEPQTAGEPMLVVAVCGGTNTGKSLIANALASSAMSRSSPEAARTRHPVASLPRGFSDPAAVARFFPGFDSVRLAGEDDPLADGAAHRLFWREDASGRQPPRLVLLDTPDVDGTLRDNWRRAELVRSACDLIVAVLTQQKYNDAAVREFFTAAAAAGKAVVVVFNMLEWPAQAAVIGGWLDTFRRQTGLEPIAVYAAPWNRERASKGGIDFFEVAADAARAPSSAVLSAADLVERLTRSDFDAIKRAAIAGSLAIVLDEAAGAPHWLETIELQAARWREARRILVEEAQVKAHLPAAPREVVWNEIWKWLEPRRSRFDMAVSGAYRIAGSGVSWIGRRIGLLRGEAEKRSDFAAEELAGLKTAMGDFLDRLDDACRRDELVRSVLGPRLVQGDRGAWFVELERRHAALPLVSEDYRTFVRGELDRFAASRPDTVGWILTGLNVGAIVRPAVTVGLGLAGAAAVPAAAATAGGLTALAHHVGDVVVGAVASIAGEGALELTTSGLKPLLESLFAGWSARRCDLLASVLRDVVLGDSLEEIDRRAAAASDPRIAEARGAIRALASGGGG
jgi:hypothetical protein